MIHQIGPSLDGSAGGGGGFSSVHTFSSGFSPATRSVSTSTKFVNGKKLTTKKSVHYFIDRIANLPPPPCRRSGVPERPII
jgi:hypothetical protein